MVNRFPLDNGLEQRNTGWPLSANYSVTIWAVLLRFPSGWHDRVPYHSSSSARPRSVQHLVWQKRTRVMNYLIVPAFLFIVLAGPINVIEHRHKNDALLDMKRMHFVLVDLNFFEEPTCGVSWQILHSNTTGSLAMSKISGYSLDETKYESLSRSQISPERGRGCDFPPRHRTLLKLVEGPPDDRIAKSTDMFHPVHPTVPEDVENDTEE